MENNQNLGDVFDVLSSAWNKVKDTAGNVVDIAKTALISTPTGQLANAIANAIPAGSTNVTTVEVMTDTGVLKWYKEASHVTAYANHLPKGTKVQYKGTLTNDGYAAIEYNGTTGYAHGYYLGVNGKRLTNVPPPTKTATTTTAATTTATNANTQTSTTDAITTNTNTNNINIMGFSISKKALVIGGIIVVGGAALYFCTRKKKPATTTALNGVRHKKGKKTTKKVGKGKEQRVLNLPA